MPCLVYCLDHTLALGAYWPGWELLSPVHSIAKLHSLWPVKLGGKAESNKAYLSSIHEEIGAQCGKQNTKLDVGKPAPSLT